MIALNLDEQALRELVSAIVRQTLEQVRDTESVVSDQLAFSESHAARLLGLSPSQLRDERRRGRVRAFQVVGRRVRYLKADLLAYLCAKQTETPGKQH